MKSRALERRTAVVCTQERSSLVVNVRDFAARVFGIDAFGGLVHRHLQIDKFNGSQSGGSKHGNQWTHVLRILLVNFNGLLFNGDGTRALWCDCGARHRSSSRDVDLRCFLVTESERRGFAVVSCGGDSLRRVLRSNFATAEFYETRTLRTLKETLTVYE